MSSNLSEAGEMKRNYELENIAELESGLAPLLAPQTSRFLHSEFLRVGLPILSGLLDDTFNPQRWEEFVGNQYVSVEIVDDNSGDVLYVLPSLLKQAPTVINNDEWRESLTSEAQHYMAIRDISPIESSASIKRVTEQSIERQNGSMEYGTPEESRAKYDVLNRIFKDSGLSEIAIPDSLTDVKPSNAVKDSAVLSKPTGDVYDFENGDDF